MSGLESVSSFPPCDYVRTLPFNGKMVPVTELIPEQVRKIEDDLAFDEALAFKFRDGNVSDRVDGLVKM